MCKRRKRRVLAVDEEKKEKKPTPRPERLPFQVCQLCRGRGRMEIVTDRRRPHHVLLRPCIVCRGRGYVGRPLTPANDSSNTVRS